MKTLTLMLLTLSLAFGSVSASAGSRWSRIDLTARFADTRFNLSGESRALGAEGVEIAFDTRTAQDHFELAVAAYGGAACELIAVASMGTRHRVRVRASAGVDDGSGCRVSVMRTGGDHAIVELYSAGT